MARGPLRLVARGIAIVLLAGFVAATLVRFTPGFGVDERSVDSRFTAHTLDSIDRDHDAERNTLTYYAHFWAGLSRGDLGRSTVFGTPVAPLLRERATITLLAVAEGLVGGWSAAVALAIGAAVARRGAVLVPILALNGALLSVPSAVLATFCVLLRLSPGLAIAAVILPRAFPHAYEQVRAALGSPDVWAARARGIGPLRILVFHVAPVVAPPLLALAGVSITVAFGASIPIEALADSPGLGQMAWRAALGRDMPVLVSVTLLLTIVAVCANIAADLITIRLRRAA